MRITFVHHCLCGPQMNILCGVKWQSEMNVCPCCMSLSVCDTKLLKPSGRSLMRITFVHHCLCGPQMNILC